MSSKIVKLTEKQILDVFLKAFADSNLSISLIPQHYSLTLFISA